LRQYCVLVSRPTLQYFVTTYIGHNI